MVKNPPASAGDIKMRVQSLGWEDPLEEGMGTHPVFLPGESHGQRNLVGYSPWGCKEAQLKGLRMHATLSDADCFFICLLALCMSSLEKCLDLLPIF